MADTFDPYYRWLSIPPEEQPPHHYRLLGLKALESDPDVIESAADRQMTHVRTFQSGKFADHSQRILNEISSAKVALLDPAKKAAYDAPLRLKLNEEKRAQKADRPLAVAKPLPLGPAAPAAPRPPEAQPPTVAPPASEPAGPSFAQPSSAASSARRARRSGLPLVAMAAIGAVVLVLIAALGAVALVVRPWETPTNVVVEDDENGANENGSTTIPPVVLPPKTDPPKVDPPEQVDPDPEETDPDDPPEDDPPEDFGEDDPPDIGLEDPEEGGFDEEEPHDLAPPKSPVPDKAERDAKQASIESIFHIAKVKSPAEKADLAANLFRTAAETPDDAVAQFVMLNLAREMASDAARMQLAFDAIDLLEHQFEFDADAIRIASIKTGASAAVPNDAKQEVVTLGVELANSLAAADRYEEATKLLTTLVELARRAREPQVAAKLIELRRVNQSLYDEYKQAQGAFETLKKSPDDPAANLAAGRFHLFVKNDAARGLTQLAKAGDDPLAAAAKLELENPQTPEEQEKLADAWHDLATKEPDKDLAKKMQSRAFAWYQRAQPGLKGLAAAKADKRLKELADAGVHPADINLDLGVFDEPPSGAPRPRRLPANLLDLVDVDAHALKQKWTRNDESIVAPPAYASFLHIPVSIAGSYELTVEFTRETGGDIVGVILPIGERYCNVLLSTSGGAAAIVGDGGDNKVERAPFGLTNGQRYTLRARVSAKGNASTVEVSVDDIVFDRWTGAGTANDVGDRRMPQRGHIGLYAHESETVFHLVKLTMLTGRATLDADASKLAASAGNSAPRDVTRGLVAHWTFDEGEGTVARDSIGGHDGTINGATWVKGVRGGALHFDGKDDIVVVGNPKELNFTGEVTISVCVRTHALPPRHNGKSGIGNVVAHGFVLNPTRELALRQVTEDKDVPAYWSLGISNVDQGSNLRVPIDELGTWIHMVFVYDGAAWNYFRNGKLIASERTPVGAPVIDGDWAIGGHAGGDPRFFHGDIDDVRIYNRGLSADEVRALYLGKSTTASAPRAAPLVPKLGLVAHWNFDEGEGTVASDSAGDNDGEIKGGAKWTKGIRGGALSFDGVDDCVHIPNHESINFAGDISLAAWVKIKALPPAGNGYERGIGNILAHGNYKNNDEVYLRIWHRFTERKYEVSAFRQREDPAAAEIPDDDIGRWVHLVGVCVGTTWKLYRNGALGGTYKNPFGALEIDADWSIAGNASVPRFFSGDIDDVRIYNRGLSAEEVRALYLGKSSAASVPRGAPAAPEKGLVAHWKFDEGQGTVARDSAGGHDGEIHGGATWSKGIRGGALRFDGKDDAVLIGNPDTLNFEGPITLAAWVRTIALPPQTTQGDGYIANVVAHGYAWDARREVRLGLEHRAQGPHWTTALWHGDGTTTVESRFDDEDLGKWAHVATVYDGRAWRLHRNGREIAETATTQGAVTVPAPWVIGALINKTERNFSGEIDDVRIYNRGLSAEEVRALYLGKTTTASAPRAAPAAPEKGLVAHWNFDDGEGTVARDSAGGHNGTIHGAARTAGVRGGALRFDGDDDNVTIENHKELNFEGPITIAAWSKLNRYPPYGRYLNIVSHGRTDNPPRAVFLRAIYADDPDDSKDGNIYELGAWNAADSGGIRAMIAADDLGKWVHLAGARDGDTWHLYRNGKEISAGASVLGAILVDAPWVIGNEAIGNDRCFDGDIDDVRIYNRGLAAGEVRDLYLGTLAASAPRVDSRQPPENTDKGLVAHWSFDEGRGTAARDAVSGEAATVSGAAWVEGKRRGALHFDGKTAHVAIAERDDLAFGGPLTMAVWIRPERIPQGITFMNVLAHGSAAERKETYLRLSNGMYAVGAYAGTHDPTELRVPEDDIDAWVHLAGVYDGASWHIYRSGELFHSHKTKHGPLPFASPWAIGASPDGKERFFQGDIDDVRIYNRALSADEVKAIYDAGAAAAPNDAQGSLPVLRLPTGDAAPAAPLPERLVVTRAMYGADTRVVDVTDYVRRALADDPYAPLQPDGRAYGDPAPSVRKALAVNYTLDRRAHSAKIAEGEVLPLPPLPASGAVVKGAAVDFRILAARFGAGLTWYDVTDAVREKIAAPADVIDWSIHKVDPWFGVHKHYCVWFDYRGKRYVRVFLDGASAALLP